jgi:hypothetical protein
VSYHDLEMMAERAAYREATERYEQRRARRRQWFGFWFNFHQIVDEPTIPLVATGIPAPQDPPRTYSCPIVWVTASRLAPAPVGVAFPTGGTRRRCTPN